MEAAALYRREAEVYRRNGDFNGAKVEELKADRYSSDLQVFVEPPRHLGKPMPLHPVARYEPLSGCYIGAFIDRDERLGRRFLDEGSQAHQSPDAFARVTGKKHASVFWYLAYGKRFPASWVYRLQDRKVAAHIAWEPNDGLDWVDDDAYLNDFARAAGRTNAPIFLRFASEMNGSWTRYGADPLQYKIKWAIVQRAMARYAPNVAMVWCVNSIPEEPIAKFYPGDEYVDWVGVNCYSVPYHDNDPRRGALRENPADLLKFVYNHYARSKPLMVCEYGASHRGAADNVERPEWAARKLREMYAALPRLYPRIKAIQLYDMNNLVWAEAGRQLSNYSVTDSDTVLAAYAQAIRPEYFLSTLGEEEGAPAPLFRLTPGAVVPARLASNGILRVSAWARCYSDRFAVEYALDGRTIARFNEFGTFETTVPGAGSGLRTLTATLTDDRGNVTVRRQYRI